MPKKVRLDLHLLTKGFVDTRQKAQNLIRAGKVKDYLGRVLDKPGIEVPEDLELKVQNPPRFVSRGGEKLLAALNAFPIQVQGRVCIDGGISTGGFTDCLLQHGASLVYGIDVGYGQIAWSIRIDKRVVLKERTNLRYVTPEDLYETDSPRPTLAVADLSFISLRKVIPVIKALLLEGADQEALLLIKPQFEVGRERVGKGGVVRDPKAHLEAIEKIIEFSRSNNWKIKGVLPSPIKGPAGNSEYLLWLGTKGFDEFPNLKAIVLKNLS